MENHSSEGPKSNKIWETFNDYPVARSTLEDILVEVGEHLNLYLYRHGDEIVYRTIL